MSTKATLVFLGTFLILRLTNIYAYDPLRVHIEPGIARRDAKSWMRRGPSKPTDVINIMVMMQHSEEQKNKLEEIFFTAI